MPRPDAPVAEPHDTRLLQALAAVDAAPVMTRYTLTAADLAGPFSPPAGADLPQAQPEVAAPRARLGRIRQGDVARLGHPGANRLAPRQHVQSPR